MCFVIQDKLRHFYKKDCANTFICPFSNVFSSSSFAFNLFRAYALKPSSLYVTPIFNTPQSSNLEIEIGEYYRKKYPGKIITNFTNKYKLLEKFSYLKPDFFHTGTKAAYLVKGGSAI